MNLVDMSPPRADGVAGNKVVREFQDCRI